MPAVLNHKQLINLANQGDFVDWDVSAINEANVVAMDTADWDTASVELFLVIGGSEEAFSSAKTLSKSGSSKHTGLDVSQAERLRAKVISADPSVGDGRIRAFGKETQ